MSDAPEWRFRHISPDQKDVEANHREQFASRGATESFVREAIQNSLDAALDGKCVEVAIRLISVPSKLAEPYLDNLWPHLDAVRSKVPERTSASSPC